MSGEEIEEDGLVVVRDASDNEGVRGAILPRKYSLWTSPAVAGAIGVGLIVFMCLIVAVIMALQFLQRNGG